MCITHIGRQKIENRKGEKRQEEMRRKSVDVREGARASEKERGREGRRERERERERETKGKSENERERGSE